jgi:hypothetical protein
MLESAEKSFIVWFLEVRIELFLAALWSPSID